MYQQELNVKKLKWNHTKNTCEISISNCAAVSCLLGKQASPIKKIYLFKIICLKILFSNILKTK